MVVFVVLGALVAVQGLHHALLRDFLRISMFAESKGTWVVVFLFLLISLYIGSRLFNYLAVDWFGADIWAVTPALGVPWTDVSNACAFVLWLINFLALFFVFDLMLQSTHPYPRWMADSRMQWQQGSLRIFVFWISFCAGSAAVAFVLAHSDRYSLSLMQATGLSTSELSRSWLASLLLGLQLALVMQDWDFPWFDASLDTRLPGLPASSLSCFDYKLLPACLHLTVSSRWAVFGLLVPAWLLNLHTLCLQLTYSPEFYAQYTDPSGRIFAVTDPAELELVRASPELLSWAARGATWAMRGDVDTHTTFLAYSLWVKLLALLPAVLAAVLFARLVYLDQPVYRSADSRT